MKHRIIEHSDGKKVSYSIQFRWCFFWFTVKDYLLDIGFEKRFDSIEEAKEYIEKIKNRKIGKRVVS